MLAVPPMPGSFGAPGGGAGTGFKGATAGDRPDFDGKAADSGVAGFGRPAAGRNSVAFCGLDAIPGTAGTPGSFWMPGSFGAPKVRSSTRCGLGAGWEAAATFGEPAIVCTTVGLGRGIPCGGWGIGGAVGAAAVCGAAVSDAPFPARSKRLAVTA
jgi:hypothetical protein